MILTLKVFDRVMNGSPVKIEMFRELLGIELQLAGSAGVVWYLEENVQFLIHVLDVFQGREGYRLQLMQMADVGAVPNQYGKRALAVTAGAAGLLEVRLRAFGDSEMDDKAHVRLVNSHAESIGTHHDAYVALLPSRLSFGTGPGVQAGMVELGALAGRLEESRRLLALAPVAHIDYAAPLHSPADAQQLSQFVVRTADDVAEVGTLEAAFEQQEAMLDGAAGALRGLDGLRPRQPALYVLRHARRGGGRQRYHRRGNPFAQAAYQQVVRPEIVPPLRDAVGLVHDDEADVQHVQIGAEQ